MKSTGLKTFLSGMLLVGTLVACGDDPFQVIEELEFAASLGIDLASMTMLNSGVYYADSVIGDGDEARVDSLTNVQYTGYLADGTQFGIGDFNFIMGRGQVIAGFEEGIFGMRENGRRLIVIPPERGYGNQDQNAIPAGSVLIFDVTVTDVGEPPEEEPPAN